MVAYYNDNDPGVCAWLRNLIAEGLIAPGDVDERSIAEVRPADLAGYDQCHFFAGIGGWSLALRLAGWPDDRPIWSGSCPCQPLSSAGKQQGHADERHLWPAFYRLVAECRPPVCFGEQVSSKDGREWLAAVRADLEYLGYAVGAADLPAAGVGAPHTRQRLWWVADSKHDGQPSVVKSRREEDERRLLEFERCCATGGMGHPEQQRAGRDARAGAQAQGGPSLRTVGDDAGAPDSVAGGMADSDGIQHDGSRPGGKVGENGPPSQRRENPTGISGNPRCGGSALGMADADGTRHALGTRQQGDDGTTVGQAAGKAALQTGHWDSIEWLPCADGKARPTQPGIFPLAHGIPARVGRLRAYGNAIVPQVAAEFVSAWMEIT